MLESESSPPEALKSLQRWFGSIIVRPIDSYSRMEAVSPSGYSMKDEALEYIAPSATLRADQRIELYNQQYWWRLLKVLQDDFPLVTRLYGYTDFNRQIAMPYLVRYPSCHWSLVSLGDKLGRWIEEEYWESDKELVLDSARLDWAFHEVFFAGGPHCIPPIQTLMTTQVNLQPYIRLFSFPYDLLSFRNEFSKHPVEHWVKADFPILVEDRRYCFVVFRTAANFVHCEEISGAEFFLLKAMSEGVTLEQACDQLQREVEAFSAPAYASLPHWIAKWMKHEWLADGNLSSTSS